MLDWSIRRPQNVSVHELIRLTTHLFLFLWYWCTAADSQSVNNQLLICSSYSYVKVMIITGLKKHSHVTECIQSLSLVRILKHTNMRLKCRFSSSYILQLSVRALARLVSRVSFSIPRVNRLSTATLMLPWCHPSAKGASFSSWLSFINWSFFYTVHMDVI